MGYNVSSETIEMLREKAPTGISRSLTIGSSDYSERVMKWPSFSRDYEDVRPKDVRLQLTNADDAMGFFRDDKTKMQNDVSVNLDFTFTGSSEQVSLFQGKTVSLSYINETCEITVRDKFFSLSQRKVGSNDAPVDYTTSSYLPSDIVWYLCTSHGGLDATKSTANTDIDYTEFSAFAEVFSADATVIQASFDGQTCTEALKKIARHTHSTIYVRGGLLTFKRIGIAETVVNCYGDGELMNVSLSFDTQDIINNQSVSGGYDQASGGHQWTVTETGSTSVNSFGQRDDILKDSNVWYVDSASAQNLAQRKLILSQDPNDKIKASTGMSGALRLMGETVTITDSFHGIADNYLTTGTTFDMNEGRTDLMLTKILLKQPFRLDVSTLNNTEEVLT